MATFEELYQRLLELDEHDTIEAKRASDLGKSVLETISAFSNEPNMGGGHILLGVVRGDRSHYPTYLVEGIEDTDKIQTDLSSQLQSSFNIPIRASIKVEKGRVVVVEIPEASPADKPIFIKKKGKFHGTFRRSGSADVKCTEDDLLVFAEGRSREAYDGRVMEETSWDDVDSDAIAEYRKIVSEGNSSPDSLGWGDPELLEALHCTKRVEGECRLTMAGLVLFGKKQAHRRLIPMIRVDYIRIPGKEWVQEPDREFMTTERRGPLMKLAEQIRHDILDDLPKAFTIPGEGMQRSEKPLIPSRVIREAVINTLMHRDYRVNSPIQILRYSNRLEFRNPGYSLKSEESLGDPGSQARNPWIAEVLHETRFAETKGRGISIMQEQMKGSGLTLPTFDSNRPGNAFSLFLLFHHLLSNDDVEWLGRFKSLSLSPEECQALVYAREMGAIDNRAFRSLSGVDTLSASRSLRRLRDENLLDSKGKGSATYYTPTEQLVQNIENDSSKPLEVDEKPIEVSEKAIEVDEKTLEIGEKPIEVGEKPIEVGQKPIEVDDEKPLEIGEKPIEVGQKPIEVDDEKPIEVSEKAIEVDEKPLEIGEKPIEVSEKAIEVGEKPIEVDGSFTDDWGLITERLRQLPKNLQKIPPELLVKVGSLGRNSKKNKVQEVIFNLCSWRPLRAEELARILARNQLYLIRNYLSPMISDKTLEYTIPEEPHHMRQAYKPPSTSVNEE
jgi:ATP-dependent DNA helicase RecG